MKSSKESVRHVLSGICHCGATLRTEAYLYINLDDPSAPDVTQGISQLNSRHCAHCGDSGYAPEPVAIDLPSEGALLVVIPKQLAYRALGALADVYAKLSARGQIFEPYFTHAELLIGDEALIERLRRGGQSKALITPLTTPRERLTSQRSSSRTLLSAAPTQSGELHGARAAQSPIPRALTPLSTGLPQRRGATPIPASNLGLGARQLTLAEELARSSTQVTIPQELEEAEISLSGELSATSGGLGAGGLDSLLDTALSGDLSAMEGSGSDLGTGLSVSDDFGDMHQTPTAITERSRERSRARAQRDQTSRDIAQDLSPTPSVAENITGSGSESAEPSTQLLYARQSRQFDTTIAQGRSRYLIVRDNRLEAYAKLDERYAERWITEELDVRIQLHTINAGGTPGLTLFVLKDGELEDELYWPIKVDDQEGPKMLRALRSDFSVELKLFKKNNNLYGQRVVQAPLEENTAYIINYIKQMRMTHNAAAKVRALVSADDYERDGQQRHPFKQDSFEEIASAADALSAVGIWTYWSTAEQRDYLIFNKSFPISWLRRLQHRVLKAAIEFGIHMPESLQSQAIALGFAKSDVELLHKTIAHFVEVNIQLKPSELDADDVWDNWESLLTQLDSLGIDADEEVELLALQAMQRAGVNPEGAGYEDEDELEELDGSLLDGSMLDGSLLDHSVLDGSLRGGLEPKEIKPKEVKVSEGGPDASDAEDNGFDQGEVTQAEELENHASTGEEVDEPKTLVPPIPIDEADYDSALSEAIVSGETSHGEAEGSAESSVEGDSSESDSSESDSAEDDQSESNSAGDLSDRVASSQDEEAELISDDLIEEEFVTNIGAVASFDELEDLEDLDELSEVEVVSEEIVDPETASLGDIELSVKRDTNVQDDMSAQSDDAESVAPASEDQ